MPDIETPLPETPLFEDRHEKNLNALFGEDTPETDIREDKKVPQESEVVEDEPETKGTESDIETDDSDEDYIEGYDDESDENDDDGSW